MATPKTTAAAIAVVALFLASIAAYLVYNYLSTKEQEATKAKLEVQQVVVAAKEIPFGQRIQAEDVKAIDWPKTSLPAGSASDPKAMTGRLTVANVPAGSPITESLLAPVNAETGVLSYIIPPGHRAITVAVNEVVGVAGFVLPNSIVDVVATVSRGGGAGADRLSKIVLQKVKVLAVGQILEQKEGKPVTVPTVTLDVTPVDAEKLAIASENKVQLILRHLGDTEEVKTRGANVNTLLGGAMPAAAQAGPARSGRPVARKAASRAVKAEDIQVNVEVIRGNSRSKEVFK
jgi:pilus assembly protein CpaB